VILPLPISGKKKVADMSKYRQLTQEERYRMAAHRMAGNSSAEIARLLGRHRSTIGREVRRNARTHDSSYGAEKAHGYLPKGECMSGLTQARCDYIARELNTRPRKRHGYSTPADLYQRH
jgi:IS30 family transposase